MGVCNVLLTVCEAAFENLFSVLKSNRWVGDFQVATSGGFWVATRGETLIIAATNHQGLLDSALWRRFDEIVFFDRPNSEAIREVLLRNMKQLGLEQGIDLELLSRDLAGMSHADIERIALDATKTSILADKRPIDAETLKSSAWNQRRRVSLTNNMTSKAEKHVSQFPKTDEKDSLITQAKE
jgi:SpoVK/Ycf46/Vps4 family AAA+-type ATPase